jgi:UDP-N-acetylmuramate dehydrogenase
MKIDDKIQNNIPLAEFTTFRIGGPAKFFVVIENQEELIDAFAWISKHQIKHIILSGGSNVLISDEGFDGLVIMIKNNDTLVRGDRIECEAGTRLSKILSSTISNNLSGLEWAIGIPGSIGGAVRGNAGAFGSSISENIETIEVYDTEKNIFTILSRRDCKFKYRTSIIKTEQKYIIWKITLRFSKGIAKKTQEKISEYNSHRSKSQPKLPSAGCVFKNLIYDELDIKDNSLLARTGIKDCVKGGKIGTGWIIDKADLRGKKIGGAKISLEHANFIVNTSDATANDVVMLISYIKQKVRQKFKIQLFEEISYIGF